MSTPTPVEIVRPKHGWPVLAGRLLGGLAWALTRGALLMVALGWAHDRIDPAIPALGYVDAMVILVIASTLSGGSDNLWWISREAKAP